MLKANKIDFRHLINLKNNLFDSPLIDRENCLPEFAFHEVVDHLESADLKKILASCQDVLMAGISNG